jgi:hypothetical protein
MFTKSSFAALFLGVMATITTMATAVNAQPASGADSSRTELLLNVGQRFSGSVSLRVSAAAHASAHAEVVDLDSSVASCKDWLKLESDLAPETDGVVNVTYTLSPSMDLSTGHYACAIAVAAPSLKSRRVVEEMDVTLGSSEIKGGPKEIRVESASGSSPSQARWQAVVVMENSGTVNYRPVGTFEILDARGNLIENIDFPQQTVFGKRDLLYVFRVNRHLAAGSYTLRARTDVGTGEMQQLAIAIVIDQPTALVQADYPVPVISAR